MVRSPLDRARKEHFRPAEIAIVFSVPVSPAHAALSIEAIEKVWLSALKGDVALHKFTAINLYKYTVRVVSQ